jgi:hypothetical protein
MVKKPQTQKMKITSNMRKVQKRRMNIQSRMKVWMEIKKP